MKRSPMPPRRQAMKRDRPPARRGKTAPPKNRRKPKPSSEFWSVQRTTIAHRAEFRCERCGCDLNQTGMEAHHRQLRSQGGGHDVTNLVALCPPCHRWCHNHPGFARRLGFIVLAAADPAKRVVQLHDGRTVLLTEEGTYDTVFDHQEETG